MSNGVLEGIFPGLCGCRYAITSPATPDYNCIAWAAGDTGAWWEPDPMDLSYWPPEAPREYTLEAYIEAYSNHGYEVCDNAEYEEGFEKIAIYTDNNGVPKHAARQLSPSYWTSKLGEDVDIEHAELEGVEGPIYGSINTFMKRPK